MTRRRASPVFCAGLSVAAVVWMAPVAVLVLTAVRSAPDLARNGTFALPHSFAWQNFADAWRLGVRDYFVNSLRVTGIKTPLGILLAAAAAFALSLMRFPGERWLFGLFLVGLIVPVQMTLVPLNIVLTDLDLVDHLPTLAGLYLGFGMPFEVLVLRGFFRTLPPALIEAAIIDGASWPRIFAQIVLPLARPAVVALLILDGIATWNEFILAQIFLRSSENRTLALGVVQFTTEISTSYDLLAAAQCITLLPALLFYVVFQRHFVSGVGGAVK